MPLIQIELTESERKELTTRAQRMELGLVAFIRYKLELSKVTHAENKTENPYLASELKRGFTSEARIRAARTGLDES